MRVVLVRVNCSTTIIMRSYNNKTQSKNLYEFVGFRRGLKFKFPQAEFRQGGGTTGRHRRKKYRLQSFEILTAADILILLLQAPNMFDPLAYLVGHFINESPKPS